MNTIIIVLSTKLTDAKRLAQEWTRAKIFEHANTLQSELETQLGNSELDFNDVDVVRSIHEPFQRHIDALQESEKLVSETLRKRVVEVNAETAIERSAAARAQEALEEIQTAQGHDEFRSLPQIAQPAGEKNAEKKISKKQEIAERKKEIHAKKTAVRLRSTPTINDVVGAAGAIEDTATSTRGIVLYYCTSSSAATAVLIERDCLYSCSHLLSVTESLTVIFICLHNITHLLQLYSGRYLGRSAKRRTVSYAS